MPDKMERLKNFIGLAQKAGKLQSGDAAVIKAMDANTLFLVLLANDAAQSVQKELEKHNIKACPVLIFENKTVLGEIIGKSPRGMLGITDMGFAAAIIYKYNSLLD